MADIELGVSVVDGRPVPEARLAIPISVFNRHGLLAGAAGTGKTKTVQLMAERLSAAGVPVFLADLKGDLSGLALPGTTPCDGVLARVEASGQDWDPQGCPVEFFSLDRDGTGVPLRATVSSFGPTLMSKVLRLNETEEQSLGLVFHFADRNQLWLDDLADLRHLLQYFASDEGKANSALLGLSSTTVGGILRRLAMLEARGGNESFGLPQFDTRDLIRTTRDGRGVVSLLNMRNCQDCPATFSTFLLWLLAKLVSDLPEVGDEGVPKLVFFLDEAHLLFDSASKAFLDEIARTVGQIRSRGVGVFFVTEVATDIPEGILENLHLWILHQVRTHSEAANRQLRQLVTWLHPDHRGTGLHMLPHLRIGEALVSLTNPPGAMVRAYLNAPQSQMSVIDPKMMAAGVAMSVLMAKYGQDENRDSADEILKRHEQLHGRAASHSAPYAQPPANYGSPWGPYAQPPPDYAGRPIALEATPRNPAPGWYRDPWGLSALRYWDGRRWASRTR